MADAATPDEVILRPQTGVVQEHHYLLHIAHLTPGGERLFSRTQTRVRRGLRTGRRVIVSPVNEQIQFRFRTAAGYDNVTPNRIQRYMGRILRDIYNVAGNLNGVLEFEPTTGSRDDMRSFIRGGGGGLGGASIVTIPFDRFMEVNFDDFLDDLEQRQYHGFEFGSLQITISYDLASYLQSQLGGNGFHTVQMPVLQNAPPWYLFDSFTMAQRQKHGVLMRGVMTKAPHLQEMRGLWFYPPPNHPLYATKNICGYLALHYAYQHARFRQGLEHRLGQWEESSDAFYQDTLDLFAHELPSLEHCVEIDTLTNGDLAELVDTYFPEYELLVFDVLMKPMYSCQGFDYQKPYPNCVDEGELTYEKWVEWTSKQLFVFLDVKEIHYLPIFNLNCFFKPKTWKSATDDIVAGTPCYPCPCCHKGIRPNRSNPRDKNGFEQHCCDSRNFCRSCGEGFMTVDDLAKHVGPSNSGNSFRCPKCNVGITNSHCFDKHRTICQGKTLTFCKSCHHYYELQQNGQVSDPHRCQKMTCGKCKQLVLDEFEYDVDSVERHEEAILDSERYGLDRPEELSGHRMFYRKIHPCLMKPSKYETAIVACPVYAFDFECRLDKIRIPTCFPGLTPATPIYTHTVNYACGQQLKPASGITCRYRWDQEPFVAKTIGEFWNIITKRSMKMNTLWYAHNFKGYDGRFILHYLERLGIIPHNMLLSGNKIMTMTVRNPLAPHRMIEFKDSLLQIPRPLKQIPDMFGLDLHLQKDYFPYEFNNLANTDYEGEVPDKNMYNYHLMNDDEQEKFDEWYTEKQKHLFKLSSEIDLYCRQDVLILKKGLEAYRDVCWKVTKLDSLKALTLADFVFRSYMVKFIPRSIDTSPQHKLYYLDRNQADFARRAFSGGRTDVRCLRYSQSNEERQQGIGLRYVDIVSLYPTVQYFDPLPTGIPKTYRWGPNDPQPTSSQLETFFGFIQCDIEPTRYMHHPLLVNTRHHRLLATLYPLKKAHLTSIEFQEALKQGYKCTRVYRIDVYSASDQLFKEFIELWLSVKICSSKKPDSDKLADVLKGWRDRFHITLTEADFQPNASMRSMAKLMLNSLWGKFAQRDDFIKSEVVGRSEDLLSYETKIRHGTYLEKSSVRFGTHAFLKQYLQPHERPSKNIAVAAFVTAHARLRLWKQLNKLEERVYYHDTDSIIYKYEPGRYNIPEGEYLGDWTSETGPDLIHEFVGLAPKVYAYNYYCTRKGYTVTETKVKGFRFNRQARFEYQHLVDILMNQGGSQSMTIPQGKFDLLPSIPAFFPDAQSKQDTSAVVSYTFDKKLQFCYLKGLVGKTTMRTYPYGSERFPDAVHEEFDEHSTRLLQIVEALPPWRAIPLAELKKAFSASFSGREAPVNNVDDGDDDVDDAFLDALREASENLC